MPIVKCFLSQSVTNEIPHCLKQLKNNSVHHDFLHNALYTFLFEEWICYNRLVGSCFS